MNDIGTLTGVPKIKQTRCSRPKTGGTIWYALVAQFYMLLLLQLLHVINLATKNTSQYAIDR